MKIIDDIDLIDEIENYDIILVGTNINCTLGNGFQYKIKKKYPLVNELNNKTPYGHIKKMGEVLVVEDDNIIIILCYITKDYNYNSKDRLDYKALEHCLKIINKNYGELNIATTLLGGSRFDGNGDKNKILKIFKKINFKNITIYNYFQQSQAEANKDSYLKLKEDTKNNRKDFYNKIKIRKETYKKNGYF